MGMMFLLRTLSKLMLTGQLVVMRAITDLDSLFSLNHLIYYYLKRVELKLFSCNFLVIQRNTMKVSEKLSKPLCEKCLNMEFLMVCIFLYIPILMQYMGYNI